MRPKNPLPDPKNKQAFEILQKSIDICMSEKSCLIGITGAGGAGKTTFAGNIISYYGHDQSLTIDLDDYLLSREERGKLEVTGYNPIANKLSLARKHLEELANQNPIKKPRYDHSTGKHLEDEIVNPKALIIVEGVTTLYENLRELFPISFFMDALKETQIKSRIDRDVNKRGYTLDQALSLYEAVQPDYKRFIEPTKKYATILVSVGTDYVMQPVHVPKELR